MDQISPDVMEAGKVDGVTPVAEFFLIVIPIILPTISTFLVANIAMLFSNQANLYAFFGGAADRSAWTFGYYLLRMTRDATMAEYPYPATVGIFLTLFSVPITFGARALLNKFGPKTE